MDKQKFTKRDTMSSNTSTIYYYIMHFWTNLHTQTHPNYGLYIPNLRHMLLLIDLHIN
jgi:hypothetical protein